MRTGVHFKVSAEQRRQLEAIAADGNSRQKHAWRARIILLSDEGYGTMAIAAKAGVSSKATVWRWQRRFMEEGVEGLLRDKTRKPGKPPVPEATVRKVVGTALSDPPAEETHWTLRALAAVVDLAASTVRLILARHKIALHRWRHSEISTDPKFEEKVHKVIGLYVNPPKDAVVLSIDEKTQIQALGRTQKGLPMKPGRPATMTRDCKRNGTTTLFAALDILTGKVIGRHFQRHRHQELIEFLEQVEASMPAGKDIHVILDNYAAHKHEAVREWLSKRDRWQFHFTPTSCSWLNAVEGFFAKLACRRLRRGVHDSIEQLEKAILDFIDLHNGEEAKPFNWTASPAPINETPWTLRLICAILPAWKRFSGGHGKDSAAVRRRHRGVASEGGRRGGLHAPLFGARALRDRGLAQREGGSLPRLRAERASGFGGGSGRRASE